MTVGSHSSVSPSAHSVHRNWDAVPRKTQPWGRTSPDHLLVGKKVEPMSLPQWERNSIGFSDRSLGVLPLPTANNRFYFPPFK